MVSAITTAEIHDVPIQSGSHVETKFALMIYYDKAVAPSLELDFIAI
jgi:hypothetical protein